MTVVRSPSYPNISLDKALNAVEKIYEKYRTYPVTRTDAATVLGYRSLSGPANKTLAALADYGLVQKAGKGEMRVTDRAKSILYPENDKEKITFLEEAALEPQLFSELRERYPEDLPPEEGVQSYLKREGFSERAIPYAAKAFINTFNFLESEKNKAVISDEMFDILDVEGEEKRSVDENKYLKSQNYEKEGRDNYTSVDTERVVFSEETGPSQYLKLVARGKIDDYLLEAVEDFVKRQRRRMQRDESDVRESSQKEQKHNDE